MTHDFAENLLNELDNLVQGLDEFADAEDYRDSLRGKCESMRAYFEDKGHLTVGQKTALENMIEGAQKWFHAT